MLRSTLPFFRLTPGRSWRSSREYLGRKGPPSPSEWGATGGWRVEEGEDILDRGAEVGVWGSPGELEGWGAIEGVDCLGVEAGEVDDRGAAGEA